MVGPCVGKHSCLGKAIGGTPEVRAEECEQFSGFHSILGEGSLVKVGTSAVNGESSQPLDVWAIKGGCHPLVPQVIQASLERKSTPTQHITKLSKLSFIEFQCFPLV